jgi:hypothetical protein
MNRFNPLACLGSLAVRVQNTSNYIRIKMDKEGKEEEEEEEEETFPFLPIHGGTCTYIQYMHIEASSLLIPYLTL